jgi:hypothetical protein
MAAIAAIEVGQVDRAGAQRQLADLALRQARVAQPLMQNVLREGPAGALEHAVQIP